MGVENRAIADSKHNDSPESILLGLVIFWVFFIKQSKTTKSSYKPDKVFHVLLRHFQSYQDSCTQNLSSSQCSTTCDVQLRSLALEQQTCIRESLEAKGKESKNNLLL